MMSRCRLLVPAIGLGAGAATSFLGIGGGAIIVPLLMIAVGLPFKQAVGTSLAAVLVISTVGVISPLAVDASNVAWMVAAVLAARRGEARCRRRVGRARAWPAGPGEARSVGARPPGRARQPGAGSTGVAR